MIWFLWLSLASADDSCRSITLPDITAVPEPAIIVLGERRGVALDNIRALRVLKALQKKTESPVTVASDLVHHKYQHVFEQYTTGALDVMELEDALSWRTQTEVSFTPYRKFITTAASGGSFHAVGIDLEPTPSEVTPPIPGVYPSVVNSVVPDGELGFGLDAKIAQTMAYWGLPRCQPGRQRMGWTRLPPDCHRTRTRRRRRWYTVAACKTPDTPVYSFCSRGQTRIAQKGTMSGLKIRC